VVPPRRAVASAVPLQWSVGLPFRAMAPMAGDTTYSRSEVWFIHGGARRCGLLGSVAVQSLRWWCWALGLSLGGGLVLHSKLVGHRRRWQCVWVVLLGPDVAVGVGPGELPRSPDGFSVVALVVVVSGVAVEVFGARRWCHWWQVSTVVVLSFPHLRRASGSGRVVLRVGVVR
jgi:hypothetical protein